jgi:hypothetical protein
MLLKEFFGKAIDIDKNRTNSETDNENPNDDLFWFIINHDKLHKDYFMPLARKMKQKHKNNSFDKEQFVKAFMPMVNKGCMEYYHREKMNGKPEKLFSKTMRQSLCEKLYSHYYEDILKDNYSLGI